MTGTVSEEQGHKLERLLGSVLDSGIQALSNLVGQEVKGHVGQLEPVDPSQLVGALDSQHAVVCGAIEHQDSGQTFRVVIPAREATTLSGYVMMSPEETIENRRGKDTLEGEELETFTEVANVLCSGFDSVLKEIIDEEIALRAQQSGVVQPGAESDGLLGDSEALIGLPFGISVGHHPESQGWLLLEPSTAEHWGGLPDGPDEEEIPAAPVRAVLTTYLADQKSLDELRRSCRRVGLELDQRQRSEVPNPAEHRDGVVLIDVPSGDPRRFEWCRRLKQHDSTVRVALLIHRPSRSQVLKAFLAKADAVMTWPITERELSPKLDALLPPADPDGGQGDDA